MKDNLTLRGGSLAVSVLYRPHIDNLRFQGGAGMRKYLHIDLAERSVASEELDGEAVIRVGRHFIAKTLLEGGSTLGKFRTKRSMCETWMPRLVAG